MDLELHKLGVKLCQNYLCQTQCGPVQTSETEFSVILLHFGAS
jgi:hypothetical protein